MIKKKVVVFCFMLISVGSLQCMYTGEKKGDKPRNPQPTHVQRPQNVHRPHTRRNAAHPDDIARDMRRLNRRRNNVQPQLLFDNQPLQEPR